MLHRLFFLGACLVSLLSGALALSGSTTTTMSNSTATARQVEFVFTLTPNETIPIAPEELLVLRLPQPWAHANSGLNDVACKISAVTRLFRAKSSLYFESNTFTVSEPNHLYAGVEMEEPITVTADMPVHVVCVLNMPKAPQPAALAEVLTGEFDSLVPLGPAELGAVVEEVVDVEAIDYSFTLNAKGPLTWDAYRALGFFGALLQDESVPTGLVFSRQQVLSAVYDHSSKSLATTLRLYPSRDASSDAALTRLRRPETSEELADYLRKARGFSLLAVNEPMQTSAQGTCFNGVRDEAESDTDCGGGSCGACLLKKRCNTGADCWSGVCNPKTHKCANAAGAVTASLLFMAALALLAMLAS